MKEIVLLEETKLPLLAMMSLSLPSMLTSLLLLGAPVSERSMAISPKLLAVVILAFRLKKEEEGL